MNRRNFIKDVTIASTVAFTSPLLFIRCKNSFEKLQDEKTCMEMIDKLLPNDEKFKECLDFICENPKLIEALSERSDLTEFIKGLIPEDCGKLLISANKKISDEILKSYDIKKLLSLRKFTENYFAKFPLSTQVAIFAEDDGSIVPPEILERQYNDKRDKVIDTAAHNIKEARLKHMRFGAGDKDLFLKMLMGKSPRARKEYGWESYGEPGGSNLPSFWLHEEIGAKPYFNELFNQLTENEIEQILKGANAEKEKGRFIIRKYAPFASREFILKTMKENSSLYVAFYEDNSFNFTSLAVFDKLSRTDYDQVVKLLDPRNRRDPNGGSVEKELKEIFDKKNIRGAINPNSKPNADDIETKPTIAQKEIMKRNTFV